MGRSGAKAKLLYLASASKKLIILRVASLLPLQLDPLLFHPDLWVCQGWRGMLHHSSKRSLWCGYSCCQIAYTVAQPSGTCELVPALPRQSSSSGREMHLNGTSRSRYGSSRRWAEKGMCTCSFGLDNSFS